MIWRLLFVLLLAGCTGRHVKVDPPHAQPLKPLEEVAGAWESADEHGNVTIILRSPKLDTAAQKAIGCGKTYVCTELFRGTIVIWKKERK
jgi:hypothetical protein